MPDLSDHDVDRIAAKLAEKLNHNGQGERRDFWIPPERHYRDHMEWETFKENEAFDAETRQALRDMAAAFRASQSRFWALFSKLVIFGMLVLAAAAIVKYAGKLQ